MGSREEKTILCIAIAIAALFLGMFVFSNVSALEDLSSSYLLTNGSRPLIGNWNAGNYNISFNGLTLGVANNNYSFPVSDGLPSQILITDGNGTLTFEDIPLVGEFEYFLHNETSDIATYYNMTTSIPTHPTFTLNSNNVADGEVLVNFATSVNFPSITVLPEGISSLHIHAYRTRVGNTEARIYYNMYARDEFGAEVLLGISMMSEQLTGLSSDYNIFTSIANPNALNLTDRIIIRIFVEKTGVGTLNTFLEIEGTTVSHFAFPSQAVSAANFVPYVGSTRDVDLGVHDLFVGSDQTPDRINTAYPDENSITIAAQDEFLFLVAEDDVFLGANVYYNGTDWRQIDGGTYPTLLEFGAGDPPWWLGTGTDADPTVFTELGRFSINGQFRLPITGSSAGILLGGDANLYRSGANLLKTDDDFEALDLIVDSAQTPDRINTEYPTANDITISAQNRFLMLSGQDSAFSLGNAYFDGGQWKRFDQADPSWYFKVDPRVANDRIEIGHSPLEAQDIISAWTVYLSLENDGQLQLPITGSSAGLLIGGDVNLYRGAASRLDMGVGDDFNLNANELFSGVTDVSPKIWRQRGGILGLQAYGGNNFAYLHVMPKGTSVISGVLIGGTDYVADPANYEFLAIESSGSSYDIDSKKGGTGSLQPINFQMGSATKLTLKTDGNLAIGTNLIDWGDGVFDIGSGNADDVNVIYYHTLTQHSDREAKENIDLWDINKDSNIILPEVYSYNWKERSFMKNVTYTEKIVDKYGNTTYVESWRMEDFVTPASDLVYGFMADEMEDSLISQGGTTYDPISLLAKSIAKIHELEDRIEYLEQFLLSPIK